VARPLAAGEREGYGRGTGTATTRAAGPPRHAPALMAACRLLRRLLLLLLLLEVLQAALNVAQLPALSALWFDAAGAALVYVPSVELMWLHAGLAAALAAGFWLLPLRLAAGAPGTAGHVTALRHAAWAGIVTLTLLAALAQLVYDANRANIPQLPVGKAVALLASYAAFLALIGWLRRRNAPRRAP
jgi:hypothetical protein